MNGVTTNHVKEEAPGLPQVLDDEMNMYLYGVDHLAQVNNIASEYLLGETFGPVDRSADTNGTVVQCPCKARSLKNLD